MAVSVLRLVEGAILDFLKSFRESLLLFFFFLTCKVRYDDTWADIPILVTLSLHPLVSSLRAAKVKGEIDNDKQQGISIQGTPRTHNRKKGPSRLLC
jgi:hypothetical protein